MILNFNFLVNSLRILLYFAALVSDKNPETSSAASISRLYTFLNSSIVISSGLLTVASGYFKTNSLYFSLASLSVPIPNEV